MKISLCKIFVFLLANVPTGLTAEDDFLVSDEPACMGSGSNVSIIGPTRRVIGLRVTEAECAHAVADANAQLVCAKFNSTDPRGWKPHHIETGHAFGRFGTSLEDCLKMVANASPGVVCTNTGTYEFRGRKPTIVNDQPYSDRNLLGSSSQQDYCIQATAEARNGWVCVCVMATSAEQMAGSKKA
jgi:hypothetical protein